MLCIKLAVFSAALALIDAFVPLTFAFASQQYSSSPPPVPGLVLLAALVKLVLLLLPASFIQNPPPVLSGVALTNCKSWTSDSTSTSSDGGVSSPRTPDTPDSPAAAAVQKDQSRKAAEVCLDVEQPGKHQKAVSWADCSTQPLASSTDGLSSSLIPSRYPSNSHWPLLLLSAVCSTAATTISLSLVGELPPYAWSQLALLQVVASAVITHSISSSRGLRAGLGDMAQAALCLLFLAICAGQGVFGGQPEPLSAQLDDEDSLVRPAAMPAQAAAGLPPMTIMGWALLAALLSTAGTRLLLLARHAGAGQQLSQRQLCISQCVLAVLCSAAWYLRKEGSLLDGFVYDISPSHEHAVLLLGASGLLSTAIACWPEPDALVAHAYAAQGAVVLAAVCSGLLLDAPQGGRFACSSFMAGVATLLLHHGMQAELPGGGAGEALAASWWQRLRGAAHAELKARRFNLRVLRDVLSLLWVVVTLALLAIMCWGQFLHTADGCFSFSHSASAAAMAKLGIKPEGLASCSDTPFPVAQLYFNSIMSAQRAAAAAGGMVPLAAAAAAAAAGSSRTAGLSNATAARSTSNSTSSSANGTAQLPARRMSVAALAKAAASPGPAWSLCPALTCSQHPACTSANTSCCAHLVLQMAAFWDAFMHSNGLSRQYTVLYDTLTTALDKASVGPAEPGLHFGVSAHALAVLERPCLKTKLWQHGYAMFLQGDSWRMCPHRQHPSPLFRQHMHQQRHATPQSPGPGLISLHVLWQHQDAAARAGSSPQHDAGLEADLSLSSWGIRGRAASSWLLCGPGEVLSTSAGWYVSLDGLRLPRPLGASLSLTNGSWASPIAAGAGSGSPAAKRAGRGGAGRCDALVSELLVRLKA